MNNFKSFIDVFFVLLLLTMWVTLSRSYYKATITARTARTDLRLQWSCKVPSHIWKIGCSFCVTFFSTIMATYLLTFYWKWIISFKDVNINSKMFYFVLHSGYGSSLSWLYMFSAMLAASEFVLAWGTKESIQIMFELFLYSEYVYCNYSDLVSQIHLFYLRFRDFFTSFC